MSRDPGRAVGLVLRTGLYVSTSLLLAGWIVHLVDPRPIGGYGGDALTGAHGWSAALMWWGLSILILTPIARIALTVIAYQRRPALRRFSVLAAVSLAVIGVGVVLGAVPP